MIKKILFISIQAFLIFANLSCSEKEPTGGLVVTMSPKTVNVIPTDAFSCTDLTLPASERSKSLASAYTILKNIEITARDDLRYDLQLYSIKFFGVGDTNETVDCVIGGEDLVVSPSVTIINKSVVTPSCNGLNQIRCGGLGLVDLDKTDSGSAILKVLAIRYEGDTESAVTGEVEFEWKFGVDQ